MTDQTETSSALKAIDPAAPDIAISRSVARLMDDLVRVPGTNIGVGLDAVVGLVPGIGDAAGTVVSGIIMIDAVRVRVSVGVLIHMGWNLVLDTAIGALPFVGDLADVAHRANRKNLRLLEKAIATGDCVVTSQTAYLTRAILVVLASVMICLAGAVFSLWLLWRLLFG